eukprot:69284-Karenia_brevis.AAC.1
MLPTPILTIRISPLINMQPGKTLSGGDLKKIVEERITTWQNPYNSEVRVSLESDLRPIET